MNVTDYNNMTDGYNESLSLNNNCTMNENNIDIIIPTLLLTIPCGLSFFLFNIPYGIYFNQTFNK